MRNEVTRRGMLCGAAAALAAACIGVPAGAQAAKRKPNLIFILADDLGYGDLGCFGQTKIFTPRLDRMAAEGMRFTDAYSGSTVCAPARCTLMTGLHTGHCRIRGNQRIPLEPTDRTLPGLLRDAGYATALIGKWGLGNEGTTGVPTKQSFEYFFGYLDQKHAHTYYPEFLWRNEEQVRLEGNKEIAPQVPVEKATYAPDLFIDEALQFIDAHAETPFFLYFATTLPHANNEGGNHFGGESGEGMPIPDNALYGDKDWPLTQKNHAAMISRLDADVGRILDKLTERGLADDTIVVFTSDNGTHKEGGADPAFFASSGPLRGIKRDLYEGGIRVPAIAWGPGRVAAGGVSDFPWANWDVLPTFAELAGAANPAGLDGVSIAPTLLGDGAQPGREYLYWEFHEREFVQALRFGQWKAVRKGLGGAVEIYDLKADLGETRDLAAERNDLVERATALFAAARVPNPDYPVAGESAA